jgi:SAM-dependent methyltransferase
MGAVGHVARSFNEQFGQPHGQVGRLVGWIMAHENLRTNRLVVDELELGVDDRVLEVGCGPGVALALAAQRASRGHVSGVDPSPVMVAQARRRSAEQIGAGRADVTVASAAALPYDEESFTRIFSVNALPHWPSAADGLAEIRRVLRPGGRVLIALRMQRAGGGADPHAHGATEADIAGLRATLGRLGLVNVSSREHDLGRETLAVISAEKAGPAQAIA